MKSRLHFTSVSLSVLALTVVVNATATGNSHAELERSSITATEAVIVEFESVWNSNSKLAHLATLAVAQELNCGAKGTFASSVVEGTASESLSLYRIAGQPLPAAPKPRQSDSAPSNILKAARFQKADAIITGGISEVKFVGDGTREHPRRAKVTLSVQVIGVITEEMENGAIAAGYSALPINDAKLSDEKMLSQAVSEVAVKIAASLQSYQTPRASVLACSEKELILDSGKQHGMVLGTELAVIRDRKVVATIRVTKVDDYKSWAVILPDSGTAQMGDEARAYFRLPS